VFVCGLVCMGGGVGVGVCVCACVGWCLSIFIPSLEIY